MADLSTKIGLAVSLLKNWHAMHYTGHFIDAHPEVKERIDELNERTKACLRRWDIKPFEDQFNNQQERQK